MRTARSLSGEPLWLLEMEAELGKDLPNQQEAIRRMAQSIRRKAAFCGELPSPLGRCLLVGRNETTRLLATSLARFLFGDANAVLRLDMEAYAEKHQISGLIGHSGGLVCAYFEGELTEPLLRCPQTVVLLEGIDKAHPDVWQILGPILTEGRLIEGLGRTVSLKNSIFLLTTLVGFAEASVNADGGRPGDDFLLETRAALERTFAAEWLRCVGDVVLLH
jgi:ATP-dependent Clp protease ATP-binding subunit ClpA